jgi:hypothetical protein
MAGDAAVVALAASSQRHPEDPVRIAHTADIASHTLHFGDLCDIEQQLAHNVIRWHEHTGSPGLTDPPSKPTAADLSLTPGRGRLGTAPNGTGQCHHSPDASPNIESPCIPEISRNSRHGPTDQAAPPAPTTTAAHAVAAIIVATTALRRARPEDVPRVFETFAAAFGHRPGQSNSAGRSRTF